MENIQYGIVGFGGIAENRIAKEGFGLDRSRFSENLPFKLVAATDINPERKKAAAGLGLTWFEDYRKMLESDRIQAVYIATSNGTHYEVAKQALLADKHILIEKPITAKLDEAEELLRIAAERSLSVSVNLMMTKNVYNRKARDLIREGALGTPEYALLHMEFLYGAAPEEAKSWRCSDPEEIGGPIGDVGGHCMDMAEFLFGSRIRKVQCVYYPPTLKINVENGALIAYELANGIQGNVRVAFNQPRGGLFGTLSNLGYELYGSAGVLRGYGTLFQLSGHRDEPLQIRLEMQDEEHHNTYHIASPPNIYQEQLREHADSILNNKPLSGEGGLHNLQLVLACHESAANGGKEIMIAGEE